MDKIANFAIRKRDWGVRRAIHWELMNALSKFGLRVHYVIVPTDLSRVVGEEKPNVPPEYETRVASRDELLAHVDRVPGLDAAFLDIAFERGDICVANFLGAELVGFAFLSYTRARATDQLDVLVPQGFRYPYKAWTHPDHRRAKLSQMRGYVSRQTFSFKHDVRSISFVETHNYASLLHSYRHPRERSLNMGLCGWMTLFGRQIPFKSRRTRWIGFEMVRRDDHRQRQYVW